MRQIKMSRAGIGIAVFACAVCSERPLRSRSARLTARQRTLPGNIARGQAIFNGYFCAACHTLKAAGPEAYGQLGVNLNKVKGGVPSKRPRPS